MNSSSSSSEIEKNTWKIQCRDHYFWNPSIRRLWKSLRTELDPEYFELVDLSGISYTLATWHDMSSWILDRLYKILREDGYSYTMRFRGVKVSATAIHLQGYFEVQQEHVRFQQLRGKILDIFREYGCPVVSGHISIPIVRFKNIYSHKRLPNLDRWEECEFGEMRMGAWRITMGSRSYSSVPVQKFISHRGNLNGRFVPQENSPDRIEELNGKGIGVEIDVWYKDRAYWLGHDAPETPVSFPWLLNFLPLRLYHCKNREALDQLHRECGRLGYEINLFYHTTEDYALTSRGHIIVHPDQACLPDSIEMMPELTHERNPVNRVNVVCSDSDRYLSKNVCAYGSDSE